jgi:hypothetical protein
MMGNQQFDIPLAYHTLFIFIEPTSAFIGALMLHFSPALYLNIVSPTAIYAPDYAPENQIIYDQLAATYILFAFIETVVLRSTKDLCVWRRVLASILICDVLHLWTSCVTAGWAVFWNPCLWRFYDWLNFATLWVPTAARVAFMTGFGLQTDIHRKPK